MSSLPNASEIVKVLLVEDNEAHAELIERAFGRSAAQIEVVRVQTLRQARAHLAQSSPDLVLLDLLLPDGEGRELLPGEGQDSQCPIVMMTSHGDEQVAVEALKAGAIDYVVKSQATFEEMPRLATRVLREWYHIVERKRAEDRLKITQFTIDHASESIFWIKPDGGFRYVNEAATTALEYTRDELLSMRVSDIDPLFPLEEWPAHWESVRKRGRTVIESRHRRKDGREFPVEISINHVLFAGEEYNCAFARDISKRRDLEEQLRQTQKLEAIGRLAGGVAHDFNNQLFVINGHSDMLLKKLATQPALCEHAANIRQAGEHAARITQQLLAFSRRQRLEPRVLDINVQLARLETMVRALIGEQIAIVLVPCETPARIKVDPTQFEQIVFNLAINAKDAMPEGGSITVETACCEMEEVLVEARTNLISGPCVRVSVTDTGTGMDRETVARIFDPFFTTKETGKGTGLGLATVHGIVRQSGGQIAVYSEPGQGTTFKLYFPRVDESGDPSGLARRPAVQVRGSETILLVEDEEAIRRLLRQALEERGFTVIEAANGVAGLKRAGLFDGLIHLLLTDVVMPEMGGVELAQRIRETRPETKIIYMSGYGEQVGVFQEKLREEVPFLQKPCTVNTLLAKVHDVLARGKS